MGASERLEFLLKLDAQGAIKGFRDVGDAADKELTKAESGLDKAGAGMTKFGTAALAGAAVVGTGLVATAGKFSELGVEVSKFSDTTGFSTEQSSRWIEVAGDLGIEAGTLEGPLNKMNVTAGKSPEKFAQFGVEIAKTKDGAVDANGTFLNVVDRLNAISDPAEKAQAATALLGKGWTGMSELIATGSESLTESLAAVSDAKVFDDSEIQGAKDYRAAMDTLSDSVEDLTLSIGKGAAPVIGIFANAIGGAVGALDKANSVTDGFAGQLLAIGTVGVGAVGALSAIAGQVIKMRDNISPAISAIQGFTGATSALSVGMVGGLGVLAVAASAYALLSDEKTETTQATKDLTAALRAEAAGQEGAVTAALSKQIIDQTKDFDGYIETLHRLGLTEADLADYITGKSNPAFESMRRAISGVRKDAFEWTQTDRDLGKSLGITTDEADNFASAIYGLRGSYEDASAAAKIAEGVTEALGLAADGTSGNVNVLQSALTGGEVAARNAATAADVLTQATHGAGEAARVSATATGDFAAAVDNADMRYNQLIGSLDATEAWNHVADVMAKYTWIMADNTATTDQQTQATRDAKRVLAEYTHDLSDVPPEKKTDIYALIDQGKLAEAQNLIDNLARPREVLMKVYTTGTGAKFTTATGTESSPGGRTMVGEQGPEIVDLPAGAVVHTATETAMMRSGRGGGVAVHLHYHGTVMQERDANRRFADGLIDMVRRGELPPNAFS